MEVPRELLVLLSNTQSSDQNTRVTSEERLKFYEKNELRKCLNADPLTRLEFPVVLTTIALDDTVDPVLRQVR